MKRARGPGLLAGLFGQRGAARRRDRRFDTPVLRPIGARSRSVGKSLPVPAASSGITFRSTGDAAFERDTEIVGQIFLERAQPIGRGQLQRERDLPVGRHATGTRATARRARGPEPIRDPKTGERSSSRQSTSR